MIRRRTTATSFSRLGRSVVTLLALLASSAPGLAGEGDPDTSFSTDGKVVIAWDGAASSTAVAALAGGDLMVAGTVGGQWAASLVRNDGTLDLLWSQNFAPFDFSGDGVLATVGVHAVARDSSARTRLAGSVVVDTDHYSPAIARLASNGLLDPTFDGDGRRIIAAPPAWLYINVLSAQFLPDGRSYFLGTCVGCLPPAIALQGFYVLRLTADGAPDPAFSGDGWAAYADDLVSLRPSALRVHPDGSVTVATTAAAGPGQLGVVLVRLTASGDLDPTFSGNGVSGIVGQEEGSPVDLVLNPETGKMVLAIRVGSGPDGDGLLGLTAQGARDSQFGTNAGWLDLELEEGTRLQSLESQSDGRIVIAGTLDANGTQPAGFFVARVLANGILDPSYDDNGVNRIEFDLVANGADRAYASALSGGRLVVVGEAERSVPEPGFAVLRIQTALIFRDGFERGSAGGWSGE